MACCATPGALEFWGLALLLIVVVGYVFARWNSATATLLGSLLVLLIAGLYSFLRFRDGVWLDFAAPLIGIQLHSWWAGFEERQHMAQLARQAHPHGDHQHGGHH